MMNASLNGLRILNTRPREQASQLSSDIRAAGGISIELPALEIKAIDNSWIDTLPDLNQINQAIFISANAVNHCFRSLAESAHPWPPTIRVIAIGNASAKALSQWNIRVDSIPQSPDSEHVLELNTLQEPKNQHILLFKGKGGRPLIEEILLQRGAKLSIVNVYERTIPQIAPDFITSIWREDLVDIILLTSEQSMLNLFELFGEEADSWLCSKTYLLISERLEQSATSLGIKKTILSHPDRIINSLFDYHTKD